MGTQKPSIVGVVADKSIGIQKTDFVTVGTNLFDVSTIIDGYVLTGSGTTANASYVLSDYIPVIANTLYSNNNNQHVAFYTLDKVYISSLNAVKSFTTPNNAAYIRIDHDKTVAAPKITDVMIVAGANFPDKYIPFAYKVSKGIEYAVGSIDASATNFLARTINLFNLNAIDDGYYLGSAGQLIANSEYFTSKFIAVNPNTLYSNNNTNQVAFYTANRTFISILNVVTSFTTPANCYYIKIASDSPVVPKEKVMLVEGSSLPTAYIPYVSLIYPQLINSAWKDYKWTSYGDSITQIGTWQKGVTSKIPLVSTVRGIGATTIANMGSIAWVDSQGNYVDRPIAYGGTTDTQPANTTQIYSSMCVDDRINTIPLDTQVVLVMGGSNDISQDVPIGTLSDVVDTTFIGAYITLINKLHARIPNARVVLMTSPFMHSETTPNAIGKTLEDYRIATRQVADLFGYPLIDIKPNMGVNELNYTTYLSDGVHPNQTGADRIAELVIGRFKSIEPLK